MARRMPDVDQGAVALGISLTRAAHAHASISEATIHRLQDRNWLVFRVLYVIWVFESVSARDVVASLQLSRQTVSNTLRSLEASGMISRTRDTEDARLMTIRLTDDGLCSVERALASQFQLDASIFEVLTEEERTTLTGLLDRVKDRITELQSDPQLADSRSPHAHPA